MSIVARTDVRANKQDNFLNFRRLKFRPLTRLRPITSILLFLFLCSCTKDEIIEYYCDIPDDFSDIPFISNYKVGDTLTFIDSNGTKEIFNVFDQGRNPMEDYGGSYILKWYDEYLGYACSWELWLSAESNNYSTTLSITVDGHFIAQDNKEHQGNIYGSAYSIEFKMGGNRMKENAAHSDTSFVENSYNNNIFHEHITLNGKTFFNVSEHYDEDYGSTIYAHRYLGLFAYKKSENEPLYVLIQ